MKTKKGMTMKNVDLRLVILLIGIITVRDTDLLIKPCLRLPIFRFLYRI